MDSRQLYKAAEHLGTTLNWEQDWIHFGIANEIKFDLIEDLIKSFLKTDQLHLVHERTNSVTIELSDALQKINELLGKSNFELWSNLMERAIQFNRVGVLLKGKKNALQQML